MYNGTSRDLAGSAETRRKGGAAYVTRTRDPIITNKGTLRQTAILSPTSVLISGIWPFFVRVSSRLGVPMYIGPMERWRAHTGPEQERNEVRHA
jgi:hypothetical protein